jgi:hypothetical protein
MSPRSASQSVIGEFGNILTMVNTLWGASVSRHPIISGKTGARYRLYNPAREELTVNLTKLVQQLKKEREQTRRRLEQLDSALKALSGVGGMKPGTARTQPTSGKRRPMSAAARKRIAAAQRARWAKWKAAQKKK